MVIFHVDMNSFFASCEQSADPALKGKPVVVISGASGRVNMVLAASYEAKAFGVKTTMMQKEAARLCPNAVFVDAHHRLYIETSEKVMSIFDDFTPLKEKVSIDEAFLDMTGTEGLFGNSRNAAELIQKRVLEELGIGCSVGISTNKFLAKMASDMKKPLGITELYQADVERVLWPMRVSELFGVGRATAKKLNDMGILTVGELAAADEARLEKSFGRAAARNMKDSANGRGSDILTPESEQDAQSIGNEMTYNEDLTQPARIKNELLFLCDTCCYRMRRQHKKAKCITVKIKYSDFKVVTRSNTRKTATDSTDAVFETASALFFDNWTKSPVRLLGVTLSNFGEESQLSLFSDEEDISGATDAVVDALREKFGYEIIGRSTLIGRKHKKL